MEIANDIDCSPAIQISDTLRIPPSLVLTIPDGDETFQIRLGPTIASQLDLPVLEMPAVDIRKEGEKRLTNWLNNQDS